MFPQARSFTYHDNISDDDLVSCFLTESEALPISPGLRLVWALVRCPKSALVPGYVDKSSGVTRSLSKRGQSLTEGNPLAKTQKNLRIDSESLDVVNVYTR